MLCPIETMLTLSSVMLMRSRPAGRAFRPIDEVERKVDRAGHAR